MKVQSDSIAEDIQRLKIEMTESLRSKNVEGVASKFAHGSVMFLLAPPLRYTEGVDSSGDNGLKGWFESFNGSLNYDFRELEVTGADNVAFCHSVDYIGGKRFDGSTTDIWVRETLGLQKINGEWKITHQHQSVPMYMDGSGKAAADLKP